MADSSKEICKWLERIADQTRAQNKLLKQIADSMKSVSDNMEQKQFDAFDAPERGIIIVNDRGCAFMNVLDCEQSAVKAFEESFNRYHSQEEQQVDDNQMTWEEYEESK